MRFCDVWYATFLHILAGVLDGVFALSCMRDFSLGYVLTKSAWTFIGSSKTKEFCLHSAVLLFPSGLTTHASHSNVLNVILACYSLKRKVYNFTQWDIRAGDRHSGDCQVISRGLGGKGPGNAELRI